MNEKTQTNPVKAIRAKCLDCCGGLVSEVKLCPIRDCALYPFRQGRNPYRQKRELSDEQKEVMAERLRKARGAKNHGQHSEKNAASV